MQPMTGAGGVAATVMLAEHVAVPPAPAAVPVYMIVAAGVTDVEPEATGVTEPTPLSIANAVVFAVVHESVEDEPVVMDAGDAVRVQIGAAGAGGYAQVTPV